MNRCSLRTRFSGFLRISHLAFSASGRAILLTAALSALPLAALWPADARAQSAAQEQDAVAETADGSLPARRFPPKAVRGQLLVLTTPDIALDGKADRFAPGVRIRDANNNLVLPATLVNQPLAVKYVRDNIGLVQLVWVLTSEEAARDKKPGFFSNLRSAFEPATAPQDDGKTPFNQLPAYKR